MIDPNYLKGYIAQLRRDYDEAGQDQMKAEAKGDRGEIARAEARSLYLMKRIEELERKLADQEKGQEE